MKRTSQDVTLLNQQNSNSSSYPSAVTDNSAIIYSNNTYSIRIRYVGECNDPPLIISGIVIPQCLDDGDVYVDDILVTESISGSISSNGSIFRIEDGTQGVGKVLTSDADGNAYWSSVSGVSNQTLSLSGNDLSISGGNSVTIPSSGTGSYLIFKWIN